MKVDLKKDLPSYSAKRGVIELVDVPRLRYLMIDGSGDPNTSVSYRHAIETLFPVSYSLKFLSKRELGRDYVVMPLEALWWADDMESFTSARDKSRWSWTAMILVPDWIPDDLVGKAKAVAAGAPAIDRVRVEELTEGRCYQTLHVGSYDDEGPVLDHLHHVVMPAAGVEPSGRHHEIYLSDARRTEPAKLRTILRQPVTAPRPPV